jgi:hypothetical protein
MERHYAPGCADRAGCWRGDQVQTIYVETIAGNSDSTVQKRMTWNVSGRFQVITIINKKNAPEAIRTTEVTGGPALGKPFAHLNKSGMAF